MMRLLLDNHSRKAPVISSASLSVLAHAAIITAWVLGTLPRSDMPIDSVRREPKLPIIAKYGLSEILGH